MTPRRPHATPEPPNRWIGPLGLLAYGVVATAFLWALAAFWLAGAS